MKKIFTQSFIIALFFSLVVPTFAFGALVTCQLNCTWCDLIALVDSVIDFVFTIAIPIVTLMVVIGGMYIMFGGASPKNYEKGKTIMKNATIGLIIMLTAWALINLIFQVLAGGGPITMNPWNIIQCTP